MQTFPMERSVDIIEARKRLEETLQTYGINWSIRTMGQRIFTAKCTLHDEKGRFLDYGYGKGNEDESLTGAIFEAVEHWFSNFGNSQKDNIKHLDSLTYATNSDFSKNLPISIIRESASAVMAFRTYNQIGSSEQVLYPVALSTPRYIDEIYLDPHRYMPDNFDYSGLERYCSNSGVAIGSNALEAIIHGLLEAIERDSLSRFLVKIFLRRERVALRRLNLESLPDSLQELHLKVTEETGLDVLIFEMENDFGIPAFCSTLSNSQFLIEETGFGCSLSREHALYRSLHELVQCYHARALFHPSEFSLKESKILKKFSRHPFHLRCAEFKLSKSCDELGYSEIDFSNVPTSNIPINLEDYQNLILSKIESAGRRAYSTIVNKLYGGQIIAHSFIESQDHFFCVTEGNFVFPNSSQGKQEAGAQLQHSLADIVLLGTPPLT